ncbi:cysteine-rich secretory protein 1-like [Arvicola amphibius]|uniref:cysteine-rich secretory protein 1-like n=1 Tax=Arvicola amphibius TaxID=1047088 RepID=UPI0018E36DC0|nr:cysteine-rich secretory protein 1-like [Arvicola amphibius]XP_038199365.1 cysteine-rich secretory protein 1-like [Arvicola amphibius]
MTSFPLLLFLAAMLTPSLLQYNYAVWNQGFEDLSTDRESIQEEIVNKHNELRQMVDPPASDLLEMEWDNEAKENAQAWANKCGYQHSPQESRNIENLRCGENIFMASYPASWSQAIQSWYDESNDFKFGSGPTTPGTAIGHYTQLVWNSSHQIGCGVAECPNHPLRYYYVCHYCPPGNFLNRIYTPYTVGEPCASCPNHCNAGLCTNRCYYEDKYSNCPSLKASLTCKHALTKENCKAACNCEDKIH